MSHRRPTGALHALELIFPEPALGALEPALCPDASLSEHPKPSLHLLNHGSGTLELCRAVRISARGLEPPDTILSPFKPFGRVPLRLDGPNRACPHSGLPPTCAIHLDRLSRRCGGHLLVHVEMTRADSDRRRFVHGDRPHADCSRHLLGLGLLRGLA